MRVQNSDAIQIIRDQAGLTFEEGFPNQLTDKIVPVLDMTPAFQRKGRTFHAAVTASGTTTITTTPPRPTQFFLTGAQVSFSKNATCDMATGQIAVTYVEDAVTKVAIGCGVLTTTAESEVASVQFANPVKVDPNTAIQVSGSFTLGLCSRVAVVYGFEVMSQQAQ